MDNKINGIENELIKREEFSKKMEEMLKSKN